MAALRPCRCGLAAPVWPLVKAMSDSREQFAAAAAASEQPGAGAASRLGA